MELKIRQKYIAKILPFLLLAILFATALVTVFVQADSYGITVDEPTQNSYGRSVLAWYQTHGGNQSFLHYPKTLYIPEHGAAFEVIVALAQQTFGYPWHTRAVITGLSAVVGIIGMALCGFELGSWWGAFLAALGLWLYPRFFGAIFNNSKDIPFTSATALVLWAVLLLVRRWKLRWRYLIGNTILAGFLIGFAIAIRIPALFWYVILFFLLAGWWIFYGSRVIREEKVVDHLLKQARSCLIIVAVSFITIIALWPYVALDPLPNLYHVYMINRGYPFPAPALFAGKIYPHSLVPRSYVPVWLLIGSPPAMVLLAAIGALVGGLRFFTKGGIEIRIVVIGLTLLFPLAILVAFRPTLYDGLRQFLFLVVPLILLAVYGLISLVSYLMQKKQKVAVVGLVVVVLIAQWQVIRDMNNLHPYEYMYFSPLVGGVPGANGQYEMDYWGICNKPAAEWLARNYKKYTTQQFPTIEISFNHPAQATAYLPRVFKVSQNHPDFYIAMTRLHLDHLFPSYRVIHTEGIEGYVACVVKAKPLQQKPRE